MVQSARTYDPAAAGVDTVRVGPIDPVLDRLDPLVQDPVSLSRDGFVDLLAFVRDGLLDPRAKRMNTCRLVPSTPPSALTVAIFQGCQ